MDRILTSPLFKNSKRYPNLLRYVVERSLDANPGHLKERTLGVEVFGREPDYDTNLDPVVRTSAVEIRKRIAQYYHEPGHETEIRIEFPPGTYAPEFRHPQRPAVETAAPAPRWRTLPLVALVSVVLLVAILFVVRPWSARPALEAFWAPVLNSPDPVLVYIGGYSMDQPQEPVSLADLQNSERVAYADATALARIVSLLSTHHKLYRTRLQIFAKLDDLKDGPAVLIGAFNNSWTLRLTGQLRFGFARNPQTHLSWIQDRTNPTAMKWFHDMTAPFVNVQEDYAIISRVVDPTTGRVVVTASGLAKFGTEAAGEFLTNPVYMDQISRQAPKDWQGRNMQLVIRTNVVGRSAGPPQIIASYFW
ncbi:MAG: hypothetical protein C5B51_09445 [Terriglobia bacterium]|nr:MAG: hypothetical protein C5B51_09445 [Terriglobia bacterium]